MGSRTNWKMSSWEDAVMGTSAAAHGRKEGDFIAGMERGVPGGEFLIARSDDGGAVFGEVGNALGEKSEELLDGGGVLEFHGIFGAAQEFFEAPKEKDFDADGL
jgi:hypothetical protein